MLRVCLVVGFLGGLAVGALLAAWQNPFHPDAHFEFGEWKSYRGTLVRDPFPMLLTAAGTWPLVGSGKWSAGRDLEGHTGGIELRGTRIWRERAGRLLEVEPGSVRTLAGEAQGFRGRLLGRRERVTGEIVDSKCWLGVMQPGAGHTHRSCAARCLHGGVPPALVTKDGRFVWLRSAENLWRHAGTTVVVEGEWWEIAGVEYLALEPVNGSAPRP